jgi:tetratricopeptide (TPR) repeat protein
MRPSRRITAVFSVLLIACMFASVVVLRRLDRMRTGAAVEEVLYISSPEVIKRMSLGYDGLLADIYWTRAVQYFGNKLQNKERRFDLLAPLLEITTRLDPQLLVVYEYGANFLAPAPPNGAGMPQRAIDLEEFGIRNNPNAWRLYYNLGFIHYIDLKDYAGAAEAFARGSQVPNAHPYLKMLAGQMAEHAGDLQMAHAIWTTTYQTAQDKSVRASAAAHLRAIKVDEDVTALEAVAARYREQIGLLPTSFSDLVNAGMLAGIPVDPLGHTYELTPDGRVQVSVPDDLPFIEKGTPPGYVPPELPKILPVD